jgi:hypothetical protein
MMNEFRASSKRMKLMIVLRYILYFLTFVFLTILTQIGGVVFLLLLYVAHQFQLSFTKSVGLFIGIYLFTTFALIPFVAPIFGRTALPLSGKLKPLNIGTCLLNRHYVTPEFREQLLCISERMNDQFEGVQTNYLDANFPFYNGFPLFPHLSHNDGKKADLAFYYRDTQTGEPSNLAPSFIGYGIYDAPTQGEVNYPKQCAAQGFWQYGFLSYWIPKWNENKLKVDSERTRTLIGLLAEDALTSKIFLEPHLKKRWELNSYANIRFHGCQAVRHDDHVHVQIK